MQTESIPSECHNLTGEIKDKKALLLTGRLHVPEGYKILAIKYFLAGPTYGFCNNEFGSLVAQLEFSEQLYWKTNDLTQPGNQNCWRNNTTKAESDNSWR